MSKERKLTETEHGLVPEGEGWFVLNAADACWNANERFGTYCDFEGKTKFTQVGMHIHILRPGQPNCLYHEEDQQEDFLVLSGECLLLVDGQERPLRKWDFFHSTPGTRHVFVGAGAEDCAILMIGKRDPQTKLLYPRDDVAVKHSASAKEETTEPPVAYDGTPPSTPIPTPAIFG